MAESNPTEFWKTLDTLKENETYRPPQADNISPDEWYTHLKKVGSRTITIKQETTFSLTQKT